MILFKSYWHIFSQGEIWVPVHPIFKRQNRIKLIHQIISDHLSFRYSNNKVFLEGTAAAKSLQSCPTLCDPRDGSPLGSPIPGILQARTLEWVAISFSNAWKWKVKRNSLSHVRLLVTLWTAAYQAPPSMGFSWQAYWSEVPLPSPAHQPSKLLEEKFAMNFSLSFSLKETLWKQSFERSTQRK